MTDDEMGWAWNSVGEIRNVYRPRPENLKTRNHLENLDVDGRIILKCKCVKWDGRVWTVFISVMVGTKYVPYTRL